MVDAVARICAADRPRKKNSVSALVARGRLPVITTDSPNEVLAMVSVRRHLPALVLSLVLLHGASCSSFQGTADPHETDRTPPTWTPIELALIEGVQVFDSQTEVRGLRASLVSGDNSKVSGVDVSLGLASSLDGAGVMLGVFGTKPRRTFHGIQLGSVNWGSRLCGAEVGVLNYVNELRGVQAGVLNVAQGARGLQVGLWNRRGMTHGLQLGLYNEADSGLQIGLINHNLDGFLPWFPVVNVSL